MIRIEGLRHQTHACSGRDPCIASSRVTEVPSAARAIFKALHCDRLGPDTKREILGKWYLVLGSDTLFFCDFRPDGSALCDDEREQRRYEIQPDVIVIRDRNCEITGLVVRRRGKYYVPSHELLLAPLVRHPESP